LQVKQTYSAEFREQALSKVLPRESCSVGSVADELNGNVLTLRKWMRGAAAASGSSGARHAKRPEDWSLEERLLALQHSHGLADEALNAWCCEREARMARLAPPCRFRYPDYPEQRRAVLRRPGSRAKRAILYSMAVSGIKVWGKSVWNG
jgi:Transposase